jgi:hypothetical protein
MTQHLIVCHTDGTPRYTLINNHGVANAVAALYGPEGEGGWLGELAAIDGPGTTLVLDVDFTGVPEAEVRQRMTRPHRCSVRIVEAGKDKHVEAIEFYADDEKTTLALEVAMADARLVAGPPAFAHTRYTLAGIEVTE